MQLPTRTLRHLRARVIQIIQLWVVCFDVGLLFCDYIWYWPDTYWVQIFVGALDDSVKDEHLRQVFGQFGELVHVKIPANKRCGFVQFADRQGSKSFSRWVLAFTFLSTFFKISLFNYLVIWIWFVGLVLSKHCPCWMVLLWVVKILDFHGVVVLQTNRCNTLLWYFEWFWYSACSHLSDARIGSDSVWSDSMEWWILWICAARVRVIWICTAAPRS